MTPDNALNRSLLGIYNHKFVTLETINKREKLDQIVYNLRGVVKQHDPSAEVLCFPAGSVGAGFANEKSDLDALIAIRYLGEENNVATDAAIQALSSQSNDELTHVGIVSFSKFLEENDHVFVAYHEGEYLSLRAYAHIFAPTLFETQDVQEHRIANSWRMLLLARLKNNYPGASHIAWDYMRKCLNRYYIYYEQNTDGKDETKRLRRVREVMSTIIGQEFPYETENQFREYRDYEDTRRQIQYPDYNELLIALQ